MASIEKRTNNGKTSYRVKIRIKGRKSQSATFKRLTDAKQWATTAEVAASQDKYLSPAQRGTITLSEAIKRYQPYLDTLKSGDGHGYLLGLWLTVLGDVHLDSIKPANITAIRDRWLAEKTKAGILLAPSTVYKRMTALSGLLRTAVMDWQLLNENPMVSVRLPKVSKGVVRFLSADETDANGQVIPGELTRLLSACDASDSPYLRVAVLLSLATGGRRGEVLGLRWSDIDWQHEQVVFSETKNGTTRAVPVPEKVLCLLRARRRIGKGLLFPSTVDLEQPVDLRTPFRTALRRAGIEDFRWHDLRHTTASWLAMNGASLLEIADVLGHKTLAMVQRYAHLSQQHTNNIVSKTMDGML